MKKTRTLDQVRKH